MIQTMQEKHIHYSTTIFRRLLDAMARPGKIVQLASPQFLTPFPSFHTQTTVRAVVLNGYALGAMLTLLDREVGFLLAANNQWMPADAPASQWLSLRSGSSVKTLSTATFAMFCDGQSNGLIRDLYAGTLLEPEHATTVWYCVEHIEDLSKQAFEGEQVAVPSWQTLELTGPGIETKHLIRMAGLGQQEPGHINATRQQYPLGIDIYCVDRDGRCIGLPRTTRIKLIGSQQGKE